MTARFPLSLCLCLFLAAAARAHASRYEGNYYALVYRTAEATSGTPIAGVNFTVYGDGSLAGAGGYGDLTGIAVFGKVRPSGRIVLSMRIGGGAPFKHKVKFDPDGKTFSMPLDGATVLRGQKIPDPFATAGVYQGATDANSVDEGGVFFVQIDGRVDGYFYDVAHGATALDGTATDAGFTAEGADGARVECTFSPERFSGTYINAAGRGGDFEGSRY